ncbi:hypothetical protein PMAC_001896 [Pneumocystis sp. 'macacae']|nr:hypothetical protein PMAC_001896 [Pneumocystis sp. 'macacae']
MSEPDFKTCSASVDDSSVLDSNLVAQNIPRRRTHRRSSAVSLDWTSIVLFSDSDSASKVDSLVNVGKAPSMNDTLSRQGSENDKDHDDVSCSTVVLARKNSTKKRLKFHSRFLAQSISSLAHLYFGGSSKKRAPKTPVPSTSGVTEYVPLQASCSMSWEPLIDLDAAILTETSDSKGFGRPKWHRRAHSVSTVLSSYTRTSGDSLHSPFYRYGYPLKRKMSVIIEDTDMTSTQIPSSSRCVSSGILEEKRGVIRSIGDAITVDNDLSVSQKGDTGSSNLERELVQDDLAQDDLPQEDMSDAFLFIDNDNILRPTNSISGNEHSFVKNAKMKPRWRHLLKGLLTRKNS